MKMKLMRSRLAPPLLVALLACAAGLAVGGLRSRGPHDHEGSEGVARTTLGTVRAPEFPAGLQWLNTDHPLRLEDLRGKVVLLDFWTYCCINCMHILPELKQLEHKYADTLVVIGVHSAKFTGERDTENIRQAILRYDIEHPVINDHQFQVWQSFAVNAWPTIVLIDPNGNVIGQRSGEITFEQFDPVIAAVVAESERAGILKRGTIELARERDRAPQAVLSYPGKVLADAGSDRLYIADSTHNRIVVTSLAGEVVETIGSGQEDFADGSFGTAAFRKPQGMALAGTRLYVADTENHAVRVADLMTQEVTTLAGNGRKPSRLNQPGDGRAVSLHSPWDLELVDGKLYVAMAGPHELWVIDPATGHAEPYAGSGIENIHDGPRLAANPDQGAALAQPSGLTSDGKRLFWADSETSSVRSLAFADGIVQTHVGHGLFDFGDADGDSRTALLQHPLGVEHVDGKVYVADTYNNKIKVLDPTTNRITTFAGTGRTGGTDGDGATATFYQPGGLSFANGKLYVADTNNGAIRVVDLASRQVSTLQLQGADKLMTPPPEAEFRGTVVNLPATTVKPGAGELELRVELPANHHLNPDAPLTLTVKSSAPGVVKVESPVTADKPELPLHDPATFTAGTTTLEVDADIYYCRTDGTGVCLFKPLRFVVPLTVADGGQSAVVLATRLDG